MLFLPLLHLLEQNESKHDGSPSPGMTDQEKEVAVSAYEAFVVIQHFFFDTETLNLGCTCARLEKVCLSTLRGVRMHV